MSKSIFGTGTKRRMPPPVVAPALDAAAQPHVEGLRLATSSERAVSAHLVELATRCGVSDTYRSLLAALESGPRQHIDLLMANGIAERPALIAVGSAGVSIVDPTFAIPGARAQVVNLTYAAIEQARLVKEGAGAARKRWLVVEGHVPATIELSKAGAEAASQVSYVINRRVEKHRSHSSATGGAAPGPVPRLSRLA